MNKSLSYVNLSLEFHAVSTFWLGSDTSGTFFTFCPTWLERTALKMHILWCRTDICSCKLSAKVSLMLDNPFPVPSLCKLNHISVCFIQISTKITCKQLIPFTESYVFFEVIPSVLGHSANFNITEISIKTARVSRLSISCDYANMQEILWPEKKVILWGLLTEKVSILQVSNFEMQGTTFFFWFSGVSTGFFFLNIHSNSLMTF